MRQRPAFRAEPGAALAALPACRLRASRPAFAQTTPRRRDRDLPGADREQRLIEGAKREKELTFYSARSRPTTSSVLVAAFDKKYGVKVKVWRADSRRLPAAHRRARPGPPLRGRRHGGLDLGARAALSREPAAGGEIALSRRPHSRSDRAASAMGGDLSQHLRAGLQHQPGPQGRPAEAFHDLLRPEWKGRLGIEAEDFDWFAQVVTEMGEAPGSSEGRRCGSSARSSPRTAFPCARGTACSPTWSPPARCRSRSRSTASSPSRPSCKGAPLDWFVLPPAVARATAQGLARNAPHPQCGRAVLRLLARRGAADPRQPPVRHREPEDRHAVRPQPVQ